jgi:hypothetical protein
VPIVMLKRQGDFCLIAVPTYEEEEELYLPIKTQLYIQAIAKTEIITAGYQNRPKLNKAGRLITIMTTEKKNKKTNDILQLLKITFITVSTFHILQHVILQLSFENIVRVNVSEFSRQIIPQLTSLESRTPEPIC